MSAVLSNPTSRPSGGSDNTPLEHKSGGHIPALDAVRGLAVVLVLYCHGTMIESGSALAKLIAATSRISWSGVDLFFVLSGFLITGILFDAKNKPNFFRNFYARRTVRIFPLYYAFLITALLVFPRVLPASINALLNPLPPNTTWYWFYLSNFYQGVVHTTHITHVSWSLAIEEQFYLAWPLVVFMCSRSKLMKICTWMFFAPIAVRVFILMTTGNTAAASNFTPCRLDGLAGGAWIALFARGSATGLLPLVPKAKKILPITAILIGIIVGATYAMGWRGGIGHSPAYITIGFTLFTLMYGSLLVLAITSPPTTMIGRLFKSRVLVTFGKYSYAVYLFHETINALIRRFLFDPAVVQQGPTQILWQFAFYLVSLPLTLVASWISWHAMEKHFLKLKDRFPMLPAIAKTRHDVEVTASAPLEDVAMPTPSKIKRIPRAKKESNTEATETRS